MNDHLKHHTYITLLYVYNVYYITMYPIQLTVFCTTIERSSSNVQNL